ncbi:MAG: heavy-metal-associated domain-containing protein [Burkholderiales bacterium]|nr:heavy-metal-associated domain-containing protein [Burkholderiales bacterium]
MIAFEVKDMSCGHCVRAITAAVAAVDQGAKVDIDLARHLVRVESSAADAGSIGAAITEAGYTPEPVQMDAVAASQAGGGRSCCGGCG